MTTAELTPETKQEAVWMLAGLHEAQTIIRERVDSLGTMSLEKYVLLDVFKQLLERSEALMQQWELKQ